MRPALKAAALMGAAQLFVSLCLFAIPVLAPAIAQTLGVTTKLVGTYSALLWTAAMIASTLSGLLIARFGAVRIAQAALIACAAGMLAGASGWIALLIVIPLLVGLGVGVETPASSVLLVRVTRRSARPLVFSLKQTGVQIGGIAAGLLLPALLLAIGWRGSLLVCAVLAAAFAFATEPARRRYDRSAARQPIGAGGGVMQSVKVVFRHRALRNLALVSFAYSAMQICLNTFMVSFLAIELHFTLVEAGMLLAIAQFGGLLGRVITGMLAGPRVPVMTMLVGAGLGMSLAAVVIGIGGAWLSFATLAAICLLFGFTASGWNGVFLAEIARHAPAAEVGRITGGILVTGYLALVFAPLAFSAIAAAASYGIAYALLAAGSAAGAVIALRSTRRAAARPL